MELIWSVIIAVFTIRLYHCRMAITGLIELTELSNELSIDNVKQIRNEIGFPEALCEDFSQITNFLFAIKRWNKHIPFNFYQALQRVRPELTEKACKIPWLCNSSPGGTEFQQQETLSIKTLIELLKAEITKAQWLLVYMIVTTETKENVSFADTLSVLLEKGFIKGDLIGLSQILKGIQREDIVTKLQVYRNLFLVMEEGEFESKFKREISSQVKLMKEWEKKLKEFSLTQYKKVQQMLGDENTVSLADVYIELTIMKQKPRPINLKDETTYNEIEYLRKITNKEVKIEPVNFTTELNNYNPTYPEIWCLIGNPGCGKTFLAKRTALRFSGSELVGILYSISVPCRNTDWHSMESTRYENESEIETEYISKWLCLGLPKGPNWAKDLAKHLTESDGEGLLLIIDGLDEFTRKVPFGKTLLFLLLTRQSLTKSTIILTSRPGAWTEISSSHELKIDRYYQVLGFSPENRDLYFKKQIKNEKKLAECKNLLARHDELAQLSLIPVNASLFAALIKGQDSTAINTLTNMYYELTLYMIRRELTRMGLQELSRVERISYLHTDIQECLKGIGFIAFLGVANRDLASEENVPLIMGQEEYPSSCLGLAHEHYRSNSVGLVTKVWTFAHLTMQEFTASHWLSNTTWTEQCYSIRFISHSSDNFSLFRMVVRFLCGLLSERAAAVLTIMHRHLTPQPIKLIGMPMTYQLRYTDIYGMSEWDKFTEIYFQLISILYETNSDSIPFWFKSFKQFYPEQIYLYIEQAVSPNEWICFLQSLKLVSQIQLIHIDTRYINTTQFYSLMQEMRNCSIELLALYFAGKVATTVLSYTEIIRDTEMEFDTKISIELLYCDFRDEADVGIFQTNNQIISCLRLTCNKYSNKVLKELSNQMSAIQCLYVNEYKSEYNYDPLVPALCQATQLRLLHLDTIPEKHIPTLQAVLPQFSQLQEIALDNNISLLPAISNLSNLTYLHIREENNDETPKDTLSVYLLQIINGNRHSLKGMELWNLNIIGFDNWSVFLNCLEFCSNLVQLKLRETILPTNDVTHWSRAVNEMKSLVELEFFIVPLYDTGLLSLCEGLVYHPAIRSLALRYCNLTSLSCDPLTHLIPTVSQMETLTVHGPDIYAMFLLKETADEFSIMLSLY